MSNDAANPYSLIVPAHTRLFISCYANAAWVQRVLLVSPALQPPEVVFQGSGQGSLMPTLDGRTLVEIPPQDLGFAIKAVFQSSRDGKTWEMSKLRCLPTAREGLASALTLVTEDGGDQDFNDTVCNIFQIQTP